MTNELRQGLPPLPIRMRALPVDDRGYPVPEFVSNLDGKRDFRVVSLDHLAKCIGDDVCWICGQLLEAWKVFAIGPLPAIQGVSNEPPSHAECAEFAVRACPFLLLPKAQYRSVDDPRVHRLPGTTRDNPGVCCLYTVTSYSYERRRKGIVFRTGPAVRVAWYTQGRPAGRDEVVAAIETSLRAVGRSKDEPALERRLTELLPV